MLFLPLQVNVGLPGRAGRAHGDRPVHAHQRATGRAGEERQRLPGRGNIVAAAFELRECCRTRKLT